MIHFIRWCLSIDSPTTQTTVAERECLASLIRGKKRIVEIGVWEGVTARQLRQRMDADATYFAVDPYFPGRLGFSTQNLIAHRTVNSVKNGSVFWIRDTGVGAAKHSEILKQPVDFVFFDGDHSYEGLKNDWNAWAGLVATNGIVGLHDSRSSTVRSIDDAGSVRFTAEVVLNDARFEVLHEVDSLTILQRNSRE